MPKLKTHSGAAKRFKKTGSGKVKRQQAFMRHILTSKDTKTKRKLGAFQRRPGALQRRRAPPTGPMGSAASRQSV